MKEPARSRILHLLIAAGHSSHDINLLMQELELDIQQEYLDKVKIQFIGANLIEPEQIERDADHGC